jgi:hypothetical protein
MPGYDSLVNFPVYGPGTALANSTTLTAISPVPDYTIPAGLLTVGSSFRITAHGVFSTTTTPTLLFGVYYGGVGGTAIVVSSAITTASSVTNMPWHLEHVFTVRATGTSGSVFGHGWLDIGTTVAAVTHLPLPQTANAAVTVDTTTAKSLVIGAQWSAASASNTITCHHLLVENMSTLA